MRTLRFAPIAIPPLFLLLMTTVLAGANQEASSEDPWVLFEMLDHSVLFQDISEKRVVYRQVAEHMMLMDIGNGETWPLDEFRPCGELPDTARIEGDWLVVQFKCLDAGETRFQSHVYNLETGETFLLAPDPPDPALPYSWYVDINDGRVVWSQLAGCDSGDIYLLDLDTRDVTQVTEGPDGRAKLNLHLGPEWLVWDEINWAEDRIISVRGANLTTGQTITVTQGSVQLGYVPLVGNGSVVWNETISGDSKIWAYDLKSQKSYQISTSGRYPYAADLSGDLLLITEEIDELPDAPPDSQGGTSNEPCEHIRPRSSSKNRVRVYDLASNNNTFVYYNPDADTQYNARIDGETAIWVEVAGQYPNDIRHVLAARGFSHQYYTPLIFR